MPSPLGAGAFDYSLPPLDCLDSASLSSMVDAGELFLSMTEPVAGAGIDTKGINIHNNSSYDGQSAVTVSGVINSIKEEEIAQCGTNNSTNSNSDSSNTGINTATSATTDLATIAREGSIKSGSVDMVILGDGVAGMGMFGHNGASVGLIHHTSAFGLGGGVGAGAGGMFSGSMVTVSPESSVGSWEDTCSLFNTSAGGSDCGFDGSASEESTSFAAWLIGPDSPFEDFEL